MMWRSLYARYAQLRAVLPADPIAPPVPRGGDPAARWYELARVAKRSADLAGVFSLFALISVLALAAEAKQLPLPLPHLLRPGEIAVTLYIPWIVPFVVGAVGLWVMNRHWLRIALALSLRETPISKLFVIAVGVVIAGAVVVLSTKLQDTGRMEDARSGVVQEQRADADRARQQALVDLDKEELARLTDPANQSYQAQAARDGAEAWQARIEIARAQDDPQMDSIERAVVSARRADQLRASIAIRIAELAAAPVQAETAASVDYDRGALTWTTALFEIVPVWLALSIEFIALVMKYLETVLERKAWSASIPAAVTSAAAPVEEVAPVDIIRLADWRGLDEERRLTNEAGAVTQEVTQRRAA